MVESGRFVHGARMSVLRARPAARPVLLPLVLSAVLCAAQTACGGPETDDQDVGDGQAQELTHPPRHVYTLTNAPFADGHPTAVVHLGKGFVAQGPLNLVVYFHGWGNCVVNDVEAANSRCAPGRPARTAHNLIGSLDKSSANAALIAVERAFEQNSSSAGRLTQPGLFRALILELLPKLSELAGHTYTEADLGKLVLATHSGGYKAVALILDRGGLTAKVSEVILLDSLYGNTSDFDAWLKGGIGTRRLANVYTAGGGTLANAQAMATRTRSWAQAAHLPPSAFLDDRTTATLSDAAFDAPLFFKRSGLSHDGVVSYYLPKLLAHAGL